MQTVRQIICLWLQVNYVLHQNRQFPFPLEFSSLPFRIVTESVTKPGNAERWSTLNGNHGYRLAVRDLPSLSLGESHHTGYDAPIHAHTPTVMAKIKLTTRIQRWCQFIREISSSNQKWGITIPISSPSSSSSRRSKLHEGSRTWCVSTITELNYRIPSYACNFLRS